MVADIKSKTSVETFDELLADSKAVLIDVRTTAEWAFIGCPQTSNFHMIMWCDFPSGEVNLKFTEQVGAAGIGVEDTIYLLCRSGVRSQSAAQALASVGYRDLTNVSDGFEGDLDSSGHRNKINGWRKANLPWKQS